MAACLHALHPGRARAQSSAPSAPFRTAAPSTDLPTPNPLEQLENTTIAIARHAEPCIVSIEGRRLNSTVTFMPRDRTGSRPGAPSSSGDTIQNSPARSEGQQDPLRGRPDVTMDGDRIQLAVNAAPTVVGSGFLVRNGFVVTTAEVTETARDVVVILADGKRRIADWAASDHRMNVAVLKVSGIDPALGLSWGDATRVYPGSFAITIGNQAGFPNSVAFGIVSGTARSGRSGSRRYSNLIQFHGAVGGGSGGPLLNSRGEVIGMIVATPAITPVVRMRHRSTGAGPRSGAPSTSQPHAPVGQPGAAVAQPPTTALPPSAAPMQMPGPPQNRQPQPWDIGPSGLTPYLSSLLYGGASSTGFALSSNDIRPVADQLMLHRKPFMAPGWIGVRLSDAPNLSPGVLITVVYVGSAADHAGLQPGDVIVALNGQPVTSTQSMLATVRLLGSGELLRLEIVRGSAHEVVTVASEPKPDEGTIEKLRTRVLPD